MSINLNYPMSQVSNKYAHICFHCEQSFMGSHELLKICPECMRKYDIDLAFEDMFEVRKGEIYAILSQSEAEAKEIKAKICDSFVEIDLITAKGIKMVKRHRIVNLVYLIIGALFFIGSCSITI